MNQDVWDAPPDETAAIVKVRFAELPRLNQCLRHAPASAVHGLLNAACDGRAPAMIRDLALPRRRPRPGPPDASSELGELGERSGDPGLLRAEVDEDGDVVLDADDPAEAVAVVRHLVVHRVLLDRLGRGTIIEGTAGQITPGRGAGRVHHFHYAALRL